ncbi:saccharopine dehydrogenase NADP-binding domain-containing protein [Clostridium tyrobutyricum]|uniref:saccharopine dehydrogenase NADP-binding domain-containing protein n=1 Tax=Clostridium tyrobutyricum TaxID=1519 RepID=UPI001C3812B7|nr:saccharopine dehydrogenase NADP-binding domain-containing protein [Clostridium tyrobutyricum]MBV4429413.1 saccharopine dehydrogenase NADP-binding domain-containing protein [Clostridium tyrobutyricum]MBV4444635.1 saccharopine dehydrogenase NADP-binding domain-containing protein [Clostridium tyrobutyricum]
MNKIIGILGYGGQVGRHVVTYLKGRYPIKCGQRVITDIFQNSEIEYSSVDVCDKAQLKKFCEGCKIIINCTGPSHYLSQKIADTVYENGSDYIDLFGTNIVKTCHDINNKVTVIGAGSFPGLSGILPIWLMQHEKEGSIRANIFAGGNECITKTACIDFLMSTFSGFGKIDSFYKEQEVRKSEDSYVKMPLIFPQNAELMEYLSDEMILSAEKSKLNELHWYNVQTNLSYKKIMRSAFWELAKNCDKSKVYTIADKVKEILMKSRANGNNWYKIWIEIEKDKLKKNYGFNCYDSYKINGRIAALCAECLYKGIYVPGIYWPFEILDCKKVIEDLLAKKILTQIGLKDLSDCEEGEI